jgi:hypothetical protein
MPLTLKKPFTEADVAKLAKPVLLPDGPRPARITEAWDAEAKKSGRAMIVAKTLVLDDEGNEREILIYLNTSNAGLLLLRHMCLACDAIEAFDAGEIKASLFPGRDVVVLIGTQKQGKWPARNVILDVLRPASAEAGRVVNLRETG